MGSEHGGGPERGKRYEGYSDYRSVSNQVANSVEAAIQAYAELEALHTEGKVKSQQAAWARRDILAAAMRLVPELKENRELDEDGVYDKILTRWIDEGDEDSGEPYLDAFRAANLSRHLPEWTHQFVMDIQTAAWEVGYLRAGRHEDNGVGADAIEEDVNELFDGLNIHAT